MLAIPWYSQYSRLLLTLGAAVIFVLFFGIRLTIRRKGFGWISFLPTLIPAIPTAVIAYDIIRNPLHGPCLPEDGCMDEASGPMVLGIIATVVVFLICLGFELFAAYVKRRKTQSSSVGAAPGSVVQSNIMLSPITAGGIPAVVYFGSIPAFLVPYVVHFGIMRIVERLFTLYGFWDATIRIALCGLLAVGYAFVERSRAPKSVCAILLAGLLSTIMTTLWIVTEAAVISIAATAVAAIALTFVFKRPRGPYLTALAVSILFSLIYMSI